MLSPSATEVRPGFENPFSAFFSPHGVLARGSDHRAGFSLEKSPASRSGGKQSAQREIATGGPEIRCHARTSQLTGRKNAKPTAEPLSETVVAYGVKITRDDGTAFFASGGAKYGNMSLAIFHQLKNARRFARELREHVRRAKAVKIQVVTAEL